MSQYSQDQLRAGRVSFMGMNGGAEPSLEQLIEHLDLFEAGRKAEEQRRQREENANYVGVRFGSSYKIYRYRCADCKVGDWILTRPNSMRNAPQVVKVVELGLGGWKGGVQGALKVPTGMTTRGGVQPESNVWVDELSRIHD